MLAGRNGAHGRTRTCTGDALDVVPLHWATRANGIGPPAGVAPARFLYKRNLQAAAWRQRWPAEPKLEARPTSPVRPAFALSSYGAAAFTRRSASSEGWSQSPVLPRTMRAYETHLSAGSTAVLSKSRRNGALTRSCTELARLPSESITENALRALENGRRETTCTSKAA